jgi:hypothetical protein
MDSDYLIQLVTILIRNPYGCTQNVLSLTFPEDDPEFMQYLEVVQGIRTSKDWKKVVEHKVGLALETLFHEH